MLNRISLAAIVAVLMSMFAVSSATAVPTRPATPPPTDFWQNKGFMNMAHQGGETEAPGNTLYAFKTAIRDRGADTLEMDGYLTQDGVFVITHDLSTNATSNSSIVDPGAQINTRTLAQLKQLDFGYKFRPGTGHYGYPHNDAPESDYIYRGIATGDKAPPEGYTANDFKIATFEEVLEAFPNTPINVDMKAPSGQPQLAIDAAEAVADIMKDYPERSEDVIVASFLSDAMTAFHAENPAHKALTAGEAELLQYVQTSGEDPIEPTPVALQPPDKYNLGGGLIVDTVPVLRENANYDKFAIHVWPQNGTPDDETTWQRVIDQGADGFFTDKPGALHEYLCETGVPRPDGTPRCDAQICPEGQTGIVPNCVKPPLPPCPEGQTGTPPNCVPPPCPEGQVGTPPNCTPPPCPPVLSYGKGRCQVNQTSKVRKLTFAKKKGKTKAGKRTKVVLRVTATKGMRAAVRVRLKSSSRQVRMPKVITVRLKPGATVRKVITLRSTRKAKGKVRIRATSGKARANMIAQFRR